MFSHTIAQSSAPSQLASQSASFSHLGRHKVAPAQFTAQLVVPMQVDWQLVASIQSKSQAQLLQPKLQVPPGQLFPQEPLTQAWQLGRVVSASGVVRSASGALGSASGAIPDSTQ